MNDRQTNSGAAAKPLREKIVGRIYGGSVWRIEDVAEFAEVMHADVAIEYIDGVVCVMAVRAPEVS